jgi:hypothetical protein
MQSAASLSVAVIDALKPVGEQLSAATKPVASRKRARRRLWELPVKHHCVLLGAAFDSRELRQMFRRGGYVDWQTAGDYQLHSSAVCFAKDRNDFSVLAHKRLDERFRPAVHRVAAASTGDDVVRLWRALVEEGDPVGAYWAALTHPACDEELDEAFSREMHMIAHEEFAARRSTLRRVRGLEERIEELLAKQAAIREDGEALRRENAALHESLSAARAEAQRANAELERWRQGDIVKAMQAREAELVSEAQAARADAQAARRSLRAALRRAERQEQRTALLRAARTHAQMPMETREIQPPDFTGCRVLCLGGKVSLIAHYRALVESAGGEFSHHDGGVEHHVGRLPAMLGAAEVVICLAGDCSHAAYRIAKRYCKAKGKPCALMGGSSVSALARCIAALGSMEREQGWNRQGSHSRRFISGPATVTSASSRSCPA